jgi:hypothetical protein
LLIPANQGTVFELWGQLPKWKPFLRKNGCFCILWTFSDTIICRQAAGQAIRAEVRGARALAFQDKLEI